MMTKILSMIRMITGGLCAAFVPVCMFYAWYSEDFARYWVYLLAPVVGLLLMMLWYVLIGFGEFRLRLKRFALGVLVLALGAALFVGLTRYEGSTGGSSLPKFVWRWAPEIDAEIASAKPVVSGLSRVKSSELNVLDGVVDSPQFLGLNRDGVWAESQASLDWEKHPPEQLWRQPIGAGWSSFAVVGRRAVTQEQRREDELVTCYDLLTGDLLWAHSDQARLESGMGGLGPRSTPTIVGERVYVFGGTGILNCLKLQTGESLWSQDLGPKMKGHFPEWGKSAAPLLLGDLVVVSGAENVGPTLLAFDSISGKEAWTYQGRGASYSSPRLLEVDGVMQIVSINGRDATGHDPATGQELWSFAWPGKYPKVAQAMLVGKDQILLTAGYGAGSFLVGVKREGGEWSVEQIWKSKRMKTKFSSVVLRGDYAYGLDGGIMACLDLKTGKRVWKGGRYGFGQQMLVGGKLLVQAEKGELAIVKADPRGFDELARFQALSHMTWNVPTLAGRYLLVRNDREVVCYRLAKNE